MVVKKIDPQDETKALKMRLSSKLNRVKEAITHLPEEEIQMVTKVKKAATPATNGKKTADGTSLAEICKGLKMEPRTARRHLRNADIEVDGGRWTFGKQQAERVRKLLKEKQAAA